MLRLFPMLMSLHVSMSLHKSGQHPASGETDSIQMCSFLQPHKDKFKKNWCKLSTDGGKEVFLSPKKKKKRKQQKKPTSASVKASRRGWCVDSQPPHIKDTTITDRLCLVSYYTLIGRLLHQFGRQQGMLGRVGLLGFRNEQTYFLICSSPLGVQLTVVAERYLHRQPVRTKRSFMWSWLLWP